MPSARTNLRRVLSGTSDANVRFNDFVQLLRALGFAECIRGDHHIFTKEGLPEIINVQPNRSMAKVYQVRQVRQIILRYELADAINE